MSSGGVGRYPAGRCLDAKGGYLSNELILASTLDTGWHLLIWTAPMGLLAEVTYSQPDRRVLGVLVRSGQLADCRWRRLPGWGAPPGEQLRLPLT
jgi:hypothetical protein